MEVNTNEDASAAAAPAKSLKGWGGNATQSRVAYCQAIPPPRSCRERGYCHAAAPANATESWDPPHDRSRSRSPPRSPSYCPPC
ncbi:hypothetical protein BGW80DRAFT_1223188 [Lactifluus volemus]|nr:hypothetical protein BGW80DRAFT_1223188 [Lactifluus volemus]